MGSRFFVLSNISMDSLAGQQLLRKDEKVVSADTALEEKKIIAFYFSAHWCPPCRLFTPMLAEFYCDLVGGGEPFEIVFVSSDKSAEELMGYMKECHGDWLAVQHGTVLGQDLKKKYVVTREGDIISKNGRSEVAEKGPQVFQKWIAASK